MRDGRGFGKIFHDTENQQAILEMADHGSVQSVERALTLLELLARQEDGARLSDLAAEAGLAASTVHRLLTTLERRRYVQTDAAGRWHVGRQSFAVGQAYSARRSFIAPAMPFLRQLRDQTRETANLGILEEGEVVTICQAESREITRATAAPGGRTPVLSSGMGKAILATWEDDSIARFIDRFGIRPFTPRGLSSAQAVMQEIAAIRARGYAVDDEEFVPGLRCVAAVVRDPNGDAACALSISGLAARMPPDRVEDFGRRVAAAAARLTEALGGQAGS